MLASLHMALIVDDLDAILSAIKASGWEAAGKPQTLQSGPNAGKCVVYVRDPDGTTIEFMQAPKADDRREIKVHGVRERCCIPNKRLELTICDVEALRGGLDVGLCCCLHDLFRSRRVSPGNWMSKIRCARSAKNFISRSAKMANR